MVEPAAIVIPWKDRVAADPPPLLQVSVVRDADLVVVAVDGELDLSTAPLLRSALRPLLAEPAPPRIVVDAAALAFADVAGLAPLLDLAERLDGRRRLELRHPRRNVRRVLEALGVGADLRPRG